MRYCSLCIGILFFLLANTYIVLLIVIVNFNKNDNNEDKADVLISKSNEKYSNNIEVQVQHLKNEIKALTIKVDEIPSSMNKLSRQLTHQNADKLQFQEDIQITQKKQIDDIHKIYEQLMKQSHLEQKQKSDHRTQNITFPKAIPLCDGASHDSKKIISYSLFGEKALHIGRFIKDVSEEALSIVTYKDFNLRIYVDSSFSKVNRDKYRKTHSNVRFCDVTRIPGYGDISKLIGTIWRFIPMADQTIDVFCSRDLDSPLLQRGGDAVKEFLKTDAILHVMRDRFGHSIPIMGGMWCYRPNIDLELSLQLLDKILSRAKKYIYTRWDQNLLTEIVWPAVKDNSLQHDAYHCKRFSGSKPFPTERREYYVGCVRDCIVYKKDKCPIECRPENHQDWLYC